MSLISFFKVVVIWHPINGKYKRERNIIAYNKINNRIEIQSLNKLIVLTRLPSKVSKDLIHYETQETMKNAKSKMLSLHAAIAVLVVISTACWGVMTSLPIITEA